jgi:Protein of unknown function (DUF1566)
MKKNYDKTVIGGLFLPLILGACVQIVGIGDPKPIEDKGESSSASSSGSGSGSGSGSSGSMGGNPDSPWIGWRMPNPATAGLPNPAQYSVDAANQIVFDKITGLFWQQTTDAQTHTWDEAEAYCNNLTQGGFDDWRIPWRVELVSIVDFTRMSPAIDPVFTDTSNAEFWSASIYPDNTGYAWGVHFDHGDTHTYDRSTALRVRCVR